MICPVCGAQVNNGEAFCPVCGAQVSYQQPQPQPDYYQPQYYEKPESNGLSICAIIFAILEPTIGLILGLIGVSHYKNPQYKNQCKVASIISGVRIGLHIIAIIAYVIAVFAVGVGSYGYYY